jgi:hypothetical protein
VSVKEVIPGSSLRPVAIIVVVSSIRPADFELLSACFRTEGFQEEQIDFKSVMVPA